MEKPITPLHSAIARILRPLARLLLRNGVSFGEFSELVKKAYVEAAFEDVRNARRKPTDSRAAVLTGLTRKEVKRLRESPDGESADAASGNRINRASRVVSGWVRDPHFQDGQGEPAELALEGKNSFSELVRRYSGDMTPRAVLDELVRVGVVAEGHRLVLRKKAYVPAGDNAEMLRIFGEDVSDLVATVDYNLTMAPDEESLYQRTLSYDNIPPDVMARWRAYAAAKSQELLETLDQWLAPYDRDINGDAAVSDHSEPRVRTGVSIFYFEDPGPQKDNGDDAS
jgi:hypothetical protein